MEIFNAHDQQLKDYQQMLKTARWVMLGFTILAVGLPFAMSAVTRGYYNPSNIHVSFWLLIVAFLFINTLSIIRPLMGFITFATVLILILLGLTAEGVHWYFIAGAGFDELSRYLLVLIAILTAMTLYMKNVITKVYRFRYAIDEQ